MSATSQDVHEGTMVAAARKLAPRLCELAAETEAARRLPVETVAALRAAGLFHMFVVAAGGGLQTDPVEACQAIEEVAAADGSTGWCVMLAAQSGAFSGLLPPAQARAIWGDGGIVASVARPIGRATVEGECYRVSGRWPFASGSSHATWFAGECVVYDGEAEAKNAHGNTLTKMLFVPAADVTVHDTWHTTGLRATASNDFSIDGALVPSGRGFQMLVDEPVDPWPLLRHLPLLFMTHGSQALGVARAARETALGVAATKPGWGNATLLRDLPRVQLAVAEAAAIHESARAWMYQCARDLWAAALTGEPDTTLLRQRVRLATSHAMRASTRAVDIVHAMAGTTSVFQASPLERHFRDIHTAAAHVMISPLTMEAAGRVELGMAPEFPFF